MCSTFTLADDVVGNPHVGVERWFAVVRQPDLLVSLGHSVNFVSQGLKTEAVSPGNDVGGSEVPGVET